MMFKGTNERSVNSIFVVLICFTLLCYLLCLRHPSFSIMKSPTPRMRHHNSPFSKEEEVWIIKRSAFMTATQLRRAFIGEFLAPHAHAQAPHRRAFQRLVKRFDESGDITGRAKSDEARRTAVTPRQRSPCRRLLHRE